LILNKGGPMRKNILMIIAKDQFRDEEFQKPKAI
jgi:hypothetical protein